MKATPGSKTIKDLLELKKYNMLYANPEYQRGGVDKTAEKAIGRLGLPWISAPPGSPNLQRILHPLLSATWIFHPSSSAPPDAKP